METAFLRNSALKYFSGVAKPAMQLAAIMFGNCRQVHHRMVTCSGVVSICFLHEKRFLPLAVYFIRLYAYFTELPVVMCVGYSQPNLVYDKLCSTTTWSFLT